jgi:hypothetical protein
MNNENKDLPLESLDSAEKQLHELLERVKFCRDVQGTIWEATELLNIAQSCVTLGRQANNYAKILIDKVENDQITRTDNS